MGALWSVALYIYSSDNGSSFNKGVSVPKATAGGFSPAAAGTFANYPPAWRMRHVYGETNSGNRISLPCTPASNGLFKGTSSSFTVNYIQGAVSYTRSGEIGERRPDRV